MKKSTVKTYIILTIFLSIMGISIAYAALQQQLQIKTSASVQSSQTSWNIVIEKESCNAFYNALAGTVEIKGTTITISQIMLRSPGDYFGCTFSIENKGEVNAKVQSVSWPVPTFNGTGATADADAKLIKSNFWMVFRWNDTGENLKIGDLLSAKEKKNLRIEYGIQRAMTTLPTNPVTFSNAVYTINFEQA